MAGGLSASACNDGVRPPDAQAPEGGAGRLAGVYGVGRPVLLRSAAAGGGCLDVVGASREVGAPVSTWECTGAPQEQFAWRVGGTLRVYDGSEAALCLTNAYADPQVGAPIVLGSCAEGEGASGQRWAVDAGGDRVRLAGTAYCLAAPVGEAPPGSAATVTLARCTDGDPTQQWSAASPGSVGFAARPAAGPARSSSGTGCGASATVTTYEVDSLMSAYAIPPLADTVAICQTWVGGDYSLRFAKTGSSDNVSPQTTSDLQTATYDAGQASGYDPAGAPIADPQPTGGTVLDYMYADDATRQAANDDPYYGLRGTQGGGCANPTQIVCDPSGARALDGGVRLNAAVATSIAGKYTRHHLTRRGIRALVDDKEEISVGPDGSRRFRKQQGNDEIIIALARDSELLVSEEVIGPERHLKATHRWARAGGGWVRERTDIEEIETIAGRRVRSAATIRFANVRVE